MATKEIAAWLELIDESFGRRAWHGPNLRGSLRGVSALTAAYRPAPDRHNIWELTVHAAYWKYAVRRRLSGEKRGSFPLEGSNWFRRDEAPDERAWQHDIGLLAAEHGHLRAAVSALREERLTAKDRHMIRGVAMHDVYHAGQITMLKRLARSASSARGSAY